VTAGNSQPTTDLEPELQPGAVCNAIAAQGELARPRATSTWRSPRSQRAGRRGGWGRPTEDRPRRLGGPPMSRAVVNSLGVHTLHGSPAICKQLKDCSRGESGALAAGSRCRARTATRRSLQARCSPGRTSHGHATPRGSGARDRNGPGVGVEGGHPTEDGHPARPRAVARSCGADTSVRQGGDLQRTSAPRDGTGAVDCGRRQVGIRIRERTRGRQRPGWMGAKAREVLV
jgi:hypothetical protein